MIDISTSQKNEELNIQQDASVQRDINVFTKIVAGAGTGKTKIISKRYVKLVNDLLNDRIDNPIERLLVITFTEKAAGEMKSRILKELRNNNISCYGQENWISTIHGFCSRILKTHSIEANLSPAFKLGDKKVLDEIYVRIIDKIINNEVEFIPYVKDVCDELRLDISLFYSQNILKLKNIANLESIFDTFFSLISKIKSLGLSPKDFLDSSIDASLSFSNVLEGLPFGFKEKNDYISAWEHHLKNYIDSSCNFDENLLKEINKTKTILDQNGKSKCEFWTQANNFPENLEPITDFEIFITKLLAFVYALYQKHLETQDLVDFDDLINKTLFIIENNEIIRNYYKKFFKHIIIDEFQDTSTAQMRLIFNLLSDEAPNITVVGDRKQSIYSFRHAKMENLNVLHKLIESKYNQKYSEIKLITNYRSSKEVLELVNFVTKDLMDIDEQLEAGLVNIETNQKNVKITNLTNIKNPQNYQKEEAKYVAYEIVKMKDEENLSFNDFAILVNSHKQADEIEKYLSEYGIPAIKKVNLSYFKKPVIKNIIALFQFLQNIADDYALIRILKIKYYDKEIYQLKKAVDEILKNIVDEKEFKTLNFAQRILTLIGCNKLNEVKSDVDILHYIINLYAVVSNINDNKRSLSLKNMYFELKKNIVPYFGLSQFDKDIADVDLLIFEKIITDYVNNQPYTTVKTFNEYIEIIKDDKEFELPQVFTDKIDAVQIMTIHASKGLEFPYVFVSAIKSSSDKDNDWLSFDLNYGKKYNFGVMINNYDDKISPKSLIYKKMFKTPKAYHEKLRLFYVALSRAKTHLNVLTFDKILKTAPADYVVELQNAFGNIVEYVDTEDLVIKPQKLKFTRRVFPTENEKIENINNNFYVPDTVFMSFSKINTFNQCSNKFLLKYIQGYPEIINKYFNNASLVGSIVHNLIYTTYLNKKVFSVDEIRIYLANSKLADSEIDEILKIYLNFEKSEYSKILNLGVLSEYSFEFAHNNVIFKGDVDLLKPNLDGSFDIIDFKTNKNIENVLFEYKKQMFIYKKAMENQDYKIKNLIILNLKSDEIKEINLTDEDLQIAENAINLDIQNILKLYKNEIQTFKNEKHCNSCGYKYICGQ